MPMKQLILLCFLLCLSARIMAQRVIVNGSVTDSKSGETLLSANVYDGLTFVGTITNNYGFYALNLQKGKVLLTCSYIGYNDYKVELAISKDTTINIALEPNLAIEEVIVRSISPQKTVESPQMSRIELKVPDLKTAPALLGEVDIIKTLQTLPGVQGGTEGSAGFFVRGGAPDQNLILLDGVPVYNVNHLFGFFSVFNADAIKNVTLLKGGFPARYGGRLSSVVDIRMKEGDLKEFHAEGSIGLLSSKLTLEGPIVKDKTSFLISGRRTYYDLLTYPFQAAYNRKYPEYKTWVAAFFYDLNVKVNHKFSDKDRLYISAYMGKDKFNVKDEYRYTNIDYHSESKDNSGLKWGNVTSSLRWNHQFSNRIFSNLTAIFSDYTFKTYLEGESYQKSSSYEENYSYDMEYYSRIRNYGIKYDFDFPVNSNNYLRFGISNTFYQFSPGVGAFQEKTSNDEYSIDTSLGTRNIPGNELYLYIEDELTLGNRFKANLGAHFSTFFIRNKNYYSIEPRISARYMVADNFSFKASYVQMTQYINLLTNSTIGLPTDLWVPSTRKILPQKSLQAAIGMAYNLNNIYEFTLETYYKEMKNLTEFDEGYGFFSMGFSDIDEIATQGIGHSYGAEFMIQKSLGKFRGWVSYTLSWSNRKFAEISYGREFPFKYDRRYNIAIVGSYDLSERVNFGAGWTFYTGSAFSLADEKAISPYEVARLSETNNSYYEYVPKTIGYLDTRNNYRMPNYHRLDVGFNFKKHLKRAERTWSFGAYNAYNRKNAFFLMESEEYDPKTDSFKPVINQITIFPIIPYLRYSLKF